MLPNKYDTEDKIEAEAERMLDRLDHDYMFSNMTEEEYDLRCADINNWVDLRYTEICK